LVTLALESLVMSQTGTNSTADNATNPGELPKSYKPSEHEDRIWQQWIDARAFHADPERVLQQHAKPYCVFIPPPNVTAALHLGHALNNTIQDILVRAHRMRGYEALWMPGTDHAGIATQAVVEKRVMKDEKKRRIDFSREAFVEKIQAFKDEYEATITNQLKKMGCSCDWDRQRFTMDDQCAAAVREAFFRLFKDGLIYRGKRLVNWDPVLQTAVSDDECYDEDIDGNFYYLRYPLVRSGAELSTPTVRVGNGGVGDKSNVVGSSPHAERGGTHTTHAKPVTWDELGALGYLGAEEHPGDQQAWITVATTRPETYLGDTAVAINPHDPRAKALTGLCVELPLVGRVIPIIKDSHVVLPERFAKQEGGGVGVSPVPDQITDHRGGPEAHPTKYQPTGDDAKAKMSTGFLKVTPAHDPNDYEIGQRHSLPIINMMGPDGRVSDKHGWMDVGDAHLYVGLPREKARAKVVEEFKARDLFEGAKPTRHSVKHSDRSKAIVEPYLSDQWYVKVTDPRMAQTANEVLVKGGGSEAHPTAAPAQTSTGLQFFPERYAKTYENWHDNIRDWCISRQLWWGHRIPVWTIDQSKYRSLGLVNMLKDWETADRVTVNYHRTPLMRDVDLAQRSDNVDAHFVCVRDEQDQELIAHLESEGFVRDPDVLDTWFSSALWPLSTLGWPDPSKYNPALNEGLLEAFNPSQCLCTAREIITLWVSRMVMFNGYLKGLSSRAQRVGNGGGHDQSNAVGSLAHAERGGTQEVPFHHVFIHAVIQDGEGRKMSKSLGNGVDPLDIIATHGADAMRFTLCHMATNTQDVRLPVKKDASGKNTSDKFDLGRNFATKLWNASRFALSMIAPESGSTTSSRGMLAREQTTNDQPAQARTPVPLISSSLLDRWMLSRLSAGFDDVEHALANYEFHEYAQSLYDLLWRDFCDWYLEGVKPTIAQSPSQQAVLGTSLSAIVRMLHPVMPYVTEVLWKHLAKAAIAHVDGIRLTHDNAFAHDEVLKQRTAQGLLCQQAWPGVSPSLRDKEVERTFDRMRSLVTMIRDVRATHQVKPSARLTLLVPATMAEFVMHAQVKPLLMTFAGLEAVEARTPGATPDAAVAFNFESAEFIIPGIGGSKETEAARVTKQIVELEKSVATLEGRLNNPGYADRAPPAMVQQTRDELAKKKSELEAARAALTKLG